VLFRSSGLAWSAYEQALARDPLSVEARKGLARLSLAQKDYRAALRQALEGLESKPDDRDLLFLIAEAYERSGNAAQARRYYYRTLRVDSAYGPAREGVRRTGGR